MAEALIPTRPAAPTVSLFLPRRTISRQHKFHPKQPGDLPAAKPLVNYCWVPRMDSSQDLNCIFCHECQGAPPTPILAWPVLGENLFPCADYH